MSRETLRARICVTARSSAPTLTPMSIDASHSARAWAALLHGDRRAIVGDREYRIRAAAEALDVPPFRLRAAIKKGQLPTRKDDGARAVWVRGGDLIAIADTL